MLTRSKDSAAMVPYWDLTDTIVDGIDALRLAGETFLPKFSKETESRYKYRLSMTKMTNIYRDSVESLSVKPFERDITLIEDEEKKPIPSEISEFIENVDGAGSNISVFSSQTFFNSVNSAISWIFVDMPPVDPNIKNKAQEKASGRQPYWCHVIGRNVLDIKSKVVNGQEVFTYMKILEPGDVDHIREFTRSDDGVVTWTLYRKTDTFNEKTKTAFVEVDNGTVTIGIIPMVPFVTGRRDGRSWKLSPPMRDAADLQIDLYQQESGLKHLKSLTAYPMLSGNGVKPDKGADGKAKELDVGGGVVLYAPVDANGNVGSWTYVEPSGESLKFLAADVKETQQQLRELARQPLTAQSDNLTVVTASTAAGKSGSAVRTWAMGLKDSLENALLITGLYLGIKKETYNPAVSIYTDFDDWLATADLADLATARENGDISQLTYWEELQRRKVLSSTFTAQREIDRLLKELPGDGPDMEDTAE